MSLICSWIVKSNLLQGPALPTSSSINGNNPISGSLLSTVPLEAQSDHSEHNKQLVGPVELSVLVGSRYGSANPHTPVECLVISMGSSQSRLHDANRDCL